MSQVPRAVWLLALVIACLWLAACGNDGGVTVELSEWAVVPDPTSVSAGEVTFEVDNVGTETHEFVVLKTDLAPQDLPTAEDGSVEEAGSDDIEVVDEIEDIAEGSTPDLTVDLDAGNYVLICNIVEEEGGETESHYQNGMRNAFTVEE